MHVRVTTEHETGTSVLFVAYHFPPSAAVGGQRAANFARSLFTLGWRVQVLTVADANVERIDRDRLHGLEGIAIHKAAVRPTLLASVTRRFKRRAAQRAPDPAVATTASPVEVGGTRPGAESLRRRLRRYVLSFLVLPDFERGWIRPAIVEAQRRIRREGIAWIVTSCPPYSVHLIGLAVKQLTGCRWAADFRDPWMTTGSKRLYPTSALSRRIESWLERKVVERADLVTFNVDRLRNAYRARYAHVDPDKFVFIPNGISRSEPRESTKYPVFTLSYTGSFYVGRSAGPVFEALRRLIEEGRIAPDSVRVRLVGSCGQMNGVPTTEVVRSYGLESIVDVHDPVGHSQALDIIGRSHLALLFAPDLPFQIPAKAYDYLATGTRILAIAQDGGTADLIKETGSGAAFAASDTQAIADFIESEMRRQGTKANGYAGSLTRFDVDAIAKELAGHFQRIARHDSPAVG